MADETVHKSTRVVTRDVIASYLHRVASAFEGDGPVPVDDSVTVDPPAESEMEVDVEREGETLTYELEFSWAEAEGGVETDVDASAAGADAAAADDVVPSETIAGSKGTFELYKDRASEWRWRLRHRNGNVIADSGEGYSKKANAVNGIRSVKHNAAGAEIDEQD